MSTAPDVTIQPVFPTGPSVPGVVEIIPGSPTPTLVHLFYCWGRLVGADAGTAVDVNCSATFMAASGAAVPQLESVANLQPGDYPRVWGFEIRSRTAAASLPASASVRVTLQALRDGGVATGGPFTFMAALVPSLVPPGKGDAGCESA
jgi:hypothetical protein